MWSILHILCIADAKSNNRYFNISKENIDSSPNLCFCSDHYNCNIDNTDYTHFESIATGEVGNIMLDLQEKCKNDEKYLVSIQSREELEDIINCPLCSDQSLFGSSHVKLDMLTSGTTYWSAELAYVATTAKELIDINGRWIQNENPIGSIDSSIPDEILVYMDGTFVDEPLPILENSMTYLVVLIGHSESVKCEGDVYRKWGLIATEMDIASLSTELWGLCQLRHQVISTESTLSTTPTSSTSTISTSTTSSSMPSTSTISTSTTSTPTSSTQTESTLTRSTPTTENPDCFENSTYIDTCPEGYDGTLLYVCKDGGWQLAEDCCYLSWIGDIQDVINNGITPASDIIKNLTTNTDEGQIQKPEELRLLVDVMESLNGLHQEQMLAEDNPIEVGCNFIEEFIKSSSNIFASEQPWKILNTEDLRSVGPELLYQMEESGWILQEYIQKTERNWERKWTSRDIDFSVCLKQKHTINEAFVFPDSDSGTKIVLTPETIMALPGGSLGLFQMVGFVVGFKSANNSIPGIFNKKSDPTKGLNTNLINLSTKRRTGGKNSRKTRSVNTQKSSSCKSNRVTRDINSINEETLENHREIKNISEEKYSLLNHYPRFFSNLYSKKNITNKKKEINKNIQVSIFMDHYLEAAEPGYQNVSRPLQPGEEPSPVLHGSECVFWDFDEQIWSSDGCIRMDLTRGRTHCMCYHLTMFAIITNFHNYGIEDIVLDWLGTVLSILSCVSVIIAYLLLHFSKESQQPRVRITKQLCVSMAVFHLSLLLFLERGLVLQSQEACEAVAPILHFLALSAIFWMLAEGTYLFQSISNVFNPNTIIPMYWALGYGMPAVIVSITLLISLSSTDWQSVDAYNKENYCWLKTDTNYIWAFTGPLLAVIIVNTVVLLLALYAALNLRINKQKNIHQKIFLWLKGMFSLNCILGPSWIFGLIYISESYVFAYFFTIFNASQGIMILIFQCMMNDKIKYFVKRTFSRRTNYGNNSIKSLSSKLSFWKKSTSTRSTTPNNSSSNPSDQPRFSLDIPRVSSRSEEPRFSLDIPRISIIHNDRLNKPNERRQRRI